MRCLTVTFSLACLLVMSSSASAMIIIKTGCTNAPRCQEGSVELQIEHGERPIIINAIKIAEVLKGMKLTKFGVLERANVKTLAGQLAALSVIVDGRTTTLRAFSKRAPSALATYLVSLAKRGPAAAPASTKALLERMKPTPKTSTSKTPTPKKPTPKRR